MAKEVVTRPTTVVRLGREQRQTDISITCMDDIISGSSGSGNLAGRHARFARCSLLVQG
jgi:hypothetical protein